MNPLPWIQLAVSLVTPLILMAVAWGRLNERDRANEKITAEILGAIKSVDTKVETMRDRSAAHDVRLSSHDTLIETLRDEVKALRALLDVTTNEHRAALHKTRNDLAELSLRFERLSSTPPAPRPRRG